MEVARPAASGSRTPSLKPIPSKADLLPMEATFAGVLGAIVGSFLNVVTYRLPRRESLVTPASHCPMCGEPVKPYDNVPVLSWLVLRGKCRSCGAGISARYPLVEAGTALLCAGAVLSHDTAAGIALSVVLVLLLVPAALIDLEHRIIPNRLTAVGAVLAVVLGTALDPGGELGRLVAGAAAGGFLLVAALLYPSGMGMGDALGSVWPVSMRFLELRRRYQHRYRNLRGSLAGRDQICVSCIDPGASQFGDVVREAHDEIGLKRGSEPAQRLHGRGVSAALYAGDRGVAGFHALRQLGLAQSQLAAPANDDPGQPLIGRQALKLCSVLRVAGASAHCLPMGSADWRGCFSLRCHLIHVR
jgi:prepilin signal peptidase PulO-like enzyme (type II secretory pathway)